MRIRLFYFAFIVFIPFFSCRSKPQDNKIPPGDQQAQINEIKRLENLRLKAGISKDVNAFDSMTAGDYLQIDMDGNVLTRQDAMKRIASSYAQLQSNEVEDMKVRIFGNIAILSGLGHPKGLMKGEEFTDAIRYTRVYAYLNDKWQVVHFQQTRFNPNK